MKCVIKNLDNCHIPFSSTVSWPCGKYITLMHKIRLLLLRKHPCFGMYVQPFIGQFLTLTRVGCLFFCPDHKRKVISWISSHTNRWTSHKHVTTNKKAPFKLHVHKLIHNMKAQPRKCWNAILGQDRGTRLWVMQLKNLAFPSSSFCMSLYGAHTLVMPRHRALHTTPFSKC